MADVDLTDRIPLARTSVEEIVARLIADAVAGLDPSDPSYPDVIGGTIITDLYGAVSLELDREADRIYNDMPAAAIPSLSFGEYLDAWATAVGLERKDENPAGVVVTFVVDDPTAPLVPIAAGTQVSTEAATDEADEIVFVVDEAGEIPAGGGTVELPATAFEPGAEGNLPSGAISQLQTEIAHVSSVTNEAPATAGADVETDEALQDRVIRKLAGGGGPGNVADYENWALEEPGVGFVTVRRNWAGAGTVRVTITDVNNDPFATSTVVDSLKNRLDPVGDYGQAPIGAEVTVDTPATQGVPVEAELELEDGYSLDGAGGTINLRPDIEEALRRYVNRLGAGVDPVRNKIIAAIVDVPHVIDTNLVAPAADVAVDDDHVAFLVEPVDLS